ncbi:MAG: TonB-dependent receptor, partial [Terriglobales bacterium]
GVTTDPRGLTSSSNGDLSFGGVRGYHTSFLVDGTDNNNGFFAQARGRYRAPYQFSNEVVQEFRVSSNTYGTELGRSGGAVINVVTKSGNNHLRGSLFYYLRDGRTAARHRFVRRKYPDRQNQFGATLGGPFKRNKIFFFAGVDQHIFHVPTVVQFENGETQLTPQPGDYEASDQALVAAAATKLNAMGGQFRSALLGTTGFVKFDFSLSPRHTLSTRLNVSRYHGENNVFFDPGSPITNHATSENGEEQVATESVSLALTSGLAPRWNNILRAQFSHDQQRSAANSEFVRTTIDDVIAGFGRSSILPRNTNEHRIHLTETVAFEGRRHSVKLGADVSLTRIRNFFPLLFGGQYIFDTIRVNPFTFKPQTFGLRISPLRAYAHGVPRYYIQNFGESVAHPDTNEIALFAQDTMRVSSRLALSLGVRYDRQTFRSDRLQANPLWPDSGKVPRDFNNFAPRVGLAASFFSPERPLVLRGGFGIFYTRIPQIYNSVIETQNGMARSHLFLSNTDFFAQQVFPVYPNPLVACPGSALSCTAPANVNGFIEREISSFDRNFQIPYVQQASLTMEKEMAKRTAIGVAYLFVAGRHLIRARDVNLPQPDELSYPVFADDGTTFTGDYYNVNSFSRWRYTPSIECPFPPCIDPLDRPISSIGSITSFESAASSTYHGFTLSAKRRMTDGFYFRMAYTWARAVDTGQDALVAGRPAQVENSANAAAERGASSTDQRHRFVLSFSADPKPFHRDHPQLRRIFNEWRFSGVMTAGSGRPVNARIQGDSNRDGNVENDRLPGAARNAYTGPNYISTDARITRRFYITERWRLEAAAESFNVFNRANKRVTISDDGFANVAATFQPIDTMVNNTHYPAYFQKQATFLQPANAYAPRQIQFSLRLKF